MMMLMRERERVEGEMETRLVARVIRIDGIVVIIASRAKEGPSMHSGVSYGVIEDLKDGVRLVRVEGASSVQVARELSPVSSANWASDAAMADVGGNAGEMEGVGALSREDRLPLTVARAVVQRVQTNCTQSLQ